MERWPFYQNCPLGFSRLGFLLEYGIDNSCSSHTCTHALKSRYPHGVNSKRLWDLKSLSSYIFISVYDTNLSMYGRVILCGISNETFEISHHISTHTLKKIHKFVDIKDIKRT